MAAGPGRPAGEEEGESKGQSSCEDAGVTPSSRQQEPPPPLKEAPPPPTLAPAPESSVACTSCRRVKAFCDRLKPCSRCKRLGMECVPQQTKRGRPPKSARTSPPPGECEAAHTNGRKATNGTASSSSSSVTGARTWSGREEGAVKEPAPPPRRQATAERSAAQQGPERPITCTPHALISFETVAMAIVRLRSRHALDQAMLDHFHDNIGLYYQEVTARVDNCVRIAAWEPSRGCPRPEPPPLPTMTRLEEEQLHWINIGWMQELLETTRAYSCCVYFLPGGAKTICNDFMTRELVTAEQLQRETDYYRANDLHSLAMVLHRDSLPAFYDAVVKACFGRGMLQEEHRTVRVVRKDGQQVQCLATVRSVHHASQPSVLGCSVRFWPLREMVDFSEFNPQPDTRKWVDGDDVQ